VKKALKQLGSPELTGQGHEAHLEHTRRCLLKIGDHINDLLAAVSKPSEVKDWRKYVVLTPNDGDNTVTRVIVAVCIFSVCVPQPYSTNTG